MGLRSVVKISKKKRLSVQLKGVGYFFAKVINQSIESKLLCQVMKIGADQTFKEFLGFMSLPINLIHIDFLKLNANVRE